MKPDHRFALTTVGHMPPGDHDAFLDQSHYASEIFRRYGATIAAHFYGHKHRDSFAVGYSDYSRRAAETADGVAFLGGALTPKSGNPVFRIYDVDPDTYEIVDFRTYTGESAALTFRSRPGDRRRDRGLMRGSAFRSFQSTSTDPSSRRTRPGSSTTRRVTATLAIHPCNGLQRRL